MGLSGYEHYDRATSNADCAAFLIWKWFDARTTLDVGCAMGFVVEGLRELGVDAQGFDVSHHAIEHAAAGAKGHLRQGSLTETLPFHPESFDVVSALETLEHLPPAAIPGVLHELRRISSGFVFATIPSFGPNEFGRDGWLEGKVRPERLEHYQSLGKSFDGPLPSADLAVDTTGAPIEGHLTIASYRWWQRQFEAAGFERCGTYERGIHLDLAHFGLTEFWSLYVFKVPGAIETGAPARSIEEVASLLARWHLDERVGNHDDIREALQRMRQP